MDLQFRNQAQAGSSFIVMEISPFGELLANCVVANYGTGKELSVSVCPYITNASEMEADGSK